MRVTIKPRIHAAIFFQLIGFTVSGTAYSQAREAFIALYNSTNGDNWTNNTGCNGVAGTECDWYGVNCVLGVIRALSLEDNSLTGTIPSQLDALNSLSSFSLDLSDNQLTGSIPSTLGDVTVLGSLDLSSNQLTGSIPSTLGNLTNLGNLDLSRNQLTGSIPSTLGNLTKLSTLDLEWNQLSGAIPAELGNISTALSNNPEVRIFLSQNQLTGSIPAELGNLTNLLTLYLFNNQLTGSIPPELGNLSRLCWVKFNDNQLTGPIPAELANLQNLCLLDLNNNQLTGPTPQWLMDMDRFSEDWVTTAFFVEVPNVTPSVSISGGNRTIVDTDSAAGESVSFTGTATDSDGTIATTQWLVDGSVVATGTSASISLSNGATVVTFKATDNGGASTSTTATITVEAPNVSPSVSISGGDRTVSDTDNAAGESVSFTATATDSDGTIATTQWLVDGSEVATGLTATIALPNGSTVVTFKATDNDGASSTATVTITITNLAPDVYISGGSRTIADTDGITGESVSFTGTAVDSDGTITTTQWLVDGSVVATGTSASISLSNGATVVTFKATDNDGASTSTTATITVEEPNVSPSVSISGGDRTVSDTDNAAGESVSFTATATDSDGTIATTQWLVDGSEVATGLTATIALPNGSTVVTFKATDNDGASSTATVTITITNLAPDVYISGGSRTIADTDGITGESVSFTGTAVDSDGTITTTQWLVDGSVVATGTSASISLSNGATVVTFKATDNDGASTSTTATITVEEPNVSPSVSISGGDRTVSDTDNAAGESVSFTATATDSDGTIATTQWLVDGSEVATGLTATIALPNGSTVVTFKATDNDGASSTATVTITITNLAPDVYISGGSRTIADTDGITGESVSFTGTAVDSDGTITTTEWLVGGSVVATGSTPSIALPNGSTVVAFKATDNDGGSLTKTVTITVATPTYTVTDEWPSPYNGVTPDSSLGLAFNNIGIYDSAGSTIYTCLRVYTDGLPGSVGGIGEFDIGLVVVSLDEGTVQITKFREFDVIGALNENVELPDCSGKFETTTGIYTDILEVGDSVLDTTWSLIDPTNLILKLSSYQELTAD